MKNRIKGNKEMREKKHRNFYIVWIEFINWNDKREQISFCRCALIFVRSRRQLKWFGMYDELKQIEIYVTKSRGYKEKQIEKVEHTRRHRTIHLMNGWLRAAYAHRGAHNESTATAACKFQPFSCSPVLVAWSHRQYTLKI